MFYTYTYICAIQANMKQLYRILFGLVLCSSLEAQVALGGLFTPIYLQPDTTEIILRDYLVDLEVSKFELPAGLNNLSKDSQRLLLVGSPSEKISTLQLYTEDGIKSLVLIKSAAREVIFRYSRKDIGRKRDLRLIGAFNNWNRGSKPLSYKKGYYSTTMLLEPGRYEYKLFLDGEEKMDPNVSEQVSNGMGGFNNVYHVPGDSLKAAPFTLDWQEETIIVKHQAPAGKLVVLWNNQKLNIPCKKKMLPVCLIAIPEEAKSIKRSYIRIYQYLGENKGRDQLIPLHYGKVVLDSKELERGDWHQARMYFMMVDRFANGDTSNDAPLADSTVHPKANYQGGDLAGIKQQVEANYFQNLGINSLWISPISQNPEDAWGLWNKGKVKSTFSGYHGYWPISNVRIDRRFGEPQLFRDLLSTAHEEDFNVILDYVANHVHIKHPIYQKNKDWATPLYLPDGTKNTEKWDEYRLTTWFDDHLPTLDLRRPEIVDPMVDSAMYWLKNYELDGFRHDATKHIDELYWRTLTYRIRKLKRSQSTYQIGETYGSPGLINSYISTGMLDAQFDFNLYDAAVTTFAKSENPENLKAVLEAGLATYGSNHLMGNISGNQDRSRFISYANGDVKFEEDSKLAGWDRTIPAAQKSAFKRLAMLHAFNYAIPGIPCIYYGDEIGLPGANDPDNRRMMHFDNWNKKEKLLFDQVAELNRLRSSEMPLLYGSTRIWVQGQLLLIRRDYFGKSILFVFNLSEHQQAIKLPFEMEIKRSLNQVQNGLIEDQQERIGPAPIKALSYQIFANY